MTLLIRRCAGIQATDGNFYGMTFYGSHDGNGKHLQKLPGRSGDPTCTIGTSISAMNPVGALVQATNGKFLRNYVVGWRRLWHGFQFHPGSGVIPQLPRLRGVGRRRTCGANGAGPAMGTSTGSPCLTGRTATARFRNDPERNADHALRFQQQWLSIPVEGLMQGTDGNFYGNSAIWVMFYGGIYRVSQAAQQRCCTALPMAAMAPAREGLWCKPPMETSMAQPIPAGPMAMVPSSE